MAVDFEFMKTVYQCVKTATCDKCSVHADHLIVSSSRSSNNTIYFCPSPEVKAAAKAKAGSGAWKKARAKAAAG